ncbi:hypothetical protein FRC11_005543 [Ceratobasidium sp. 423]|nr:hypothetical protein FRC11_005543 [Ceratobasidium sp. 423]
MQLATLTILALGLVSQGHAMRIVTRQDFMNGLIEQLNSQNRTSFSAALSQAASSGTPQGEQLVTNLMATNRTLLAPINEMLDPLIQGQDNATVANLVSYHLMNESVNTDSVGPPNTRRHVSTFLTDPELVNLGPGNAQVQVVEKSPDGNSIMFRRADGNSTVQSTSQYQNNLVLHMIDVPIPPPGDLQQTLGQNLTGAPTNQFASFNNSLQTTGLLGFTRDEPRSTILAPIDIAWQDVNVTGLSNTSAILARCYYSGDCENKKLKRIIRNHVITGDVLYSYDISKSPNATSVSGGKLRFVVDQNETYIISGNTRARVIRADIPIKNGVIYVIDKVLN